MRVVSLLPSATELCYALGVEPVGVSHECDHPPAATDLPTVIHSRVDASATSGEIDDQVQAAVDEGGVYELDRERLAELDPDVIVSQGICDVCAVDDSLVREAVADLELDCEVVATDPHSLDDLLADVERLGRVLGREERARTVLANLEARVDAVGRETPESGPSVVVLDWLDPVMVAGHWVPEMVELAGGTYGLAEPGDPSRPHEWSDIRAEDPDLLVVAPCGFGVDQTLDNTADLIGREGWEQLRAVRNGRVQIIDGHHYMNRPGPRLVDSLELLAGIVHPETVETSDEVVRPWPDLPRDSRPRQ
ncbi:cobalamin-binding protein [Halovenus marina]|uniref:cobalamin-binding protein n=1 Tax=Halovenus marina TaxID=3396621 RepID=UPI003F54A74F